MRNHFSLSQARLALQCPLAHWYRYEANIVGAEASEAAERGSELDALLNSWFIGSLPVTDDDEVWADFQAVLDNHIQQGRPQVEILISLEGIPIPVLGFADLVTEDMVWEHKRGGGWDDAWWEAAKRQVALYANALGKDHGGIVQVKDGKVSIVEFEITDELVQSVHDEMRAGWDALGSAATPGKACAMCDYEVSCPASVFKALHERLYAPEDSSVTPDNGDAHE